MSRNDRTERKLPGDPLLIALQFNDHINHQNIKGISNMMTEDHRFIDRAGEEVIGKESMLRGWSEFFELFPEYINIFEKVERIRNLVILYGYAIWQTGEAPDRAIWTATIENNRVSEWHIYEDTKENREKFSPHTA